MLSKEVKIKSNEIPFGWSNEAADFANKLLKRKMKDRLGSGGLKELKEHLWLKGIQWDDILHKEVKTPFVPNCGDNFDSEFSNRKEEIEKEVYDYFLNKVNREGHFKDFYYNYYEQKPNQIEVTKLKIKEENQSVKRSSKETTKLSIDNSHSNFNQKIKLI